MSALSSIKERWNNRAIKPISNLSNNKKGFGSFFFTPFFPALHAIDDWQDFKSFWTTYKDDEENIILDPQALTATMAMCSSVISLAWMSAAAVIPPAFDKFQASGKHHDKITTALQDIECGDFSADQMSMLCGSASITETPYSFALTPFITGYDRILAQTVHVVASRDIRKTYNDAGMAAFSLCVTESYASFPADKTSFTDEEFGARSKVRHSEGCATLTSSELDFSSLTPAGQ